eukprot:208242-Hanusia_phi.AAC.4
MRRGGRGGRRGNQIRRRYDLAGSRQQLGVFLRVELRFLGAAGGEVSASGQRGEEEETCARCRYRTRAD